MEKDKIIKDHNNEKNVKLKGSERKLSKRTRKQE